MTFQETAVSSVAPIPDPRELRLKLLKNGFEPILVTGKRPVASGWQKVEITPEWLSEEQANHPAATNTGLRTGKLVALDNDLLSADDARIIGDTATEILGFTPFQRRGAKPEPMVLYRCEASVRKITVRARSPGSSDKRTVFEVLGQGQQVVVYGDHPDTGQPYSWELGFIGEEPANLTFESVPEVTLEKIREAVRAIGARLEELGYTQVSIKDAGAERERLPSPRTSSPINEMTLEKILSYVDPNEPREEWIRSIAGIRAAPLDNDPDESKRRAFAQRFSEGRLDRHGRYNDAPPPRYTCPEDVDLAFDTMPPKEGGVGFGTLVAKARDAGFNEWLQRFDAQSTFGHFVSSQVDSGGYPGPLSASELANGEFPRAQYLIEGMILKEHVNVLYGDGGVGKTTLALNAAVLTATGRPFHNRNTMQARALLVLAEDDYGETKHRLEAICAHYGFNLADLPIDIWCLPGHDVTLASIDDNGSIVSRPFLDELRIRLRANTGMFVVLDSIADMACLDESQRLSVNAFLKRLLGGICKEFAATILLLGHPSKTSMQDGTYYSGSTAFNNAVRSRLVLEQPVTSSDRRILKVAKVNYGMKSDLELFLMGSVFLAASDAGRVDHEKAEQEAVLATALEMIDKEISIVRSNGNGQKMKDVARAVYDKHKIKIEPARVLSILNQAESDCILRYRSADRNKRERAGFIRRSAS